jgi:hypothetical protein
MTEGVVDFSAEYSVSLIDDAARAFVHQLFRRYLWLLVFACVMNIVGLVAILVLPGATTWMIIVIGPLAALGPLYFPWAYYRLPRQLSARMKEVLVPNAQVSIAQSTFTLAAKGRSFTSRWIDLKAITEYADYFIFVVGLLAFTFIPKKNIPAEAQQLIREAAAKLVQPNPSMQPTGQERPAAD